MTLKILTARFIKNFHSNIISQRRVRTLAYRLAELLPLDRSLSCVDVGCGTGEIAMTMQKFRPNVKFTCVDIAAREHGIKDIIIFDGKKLPFDDKSYDFSMLVNVLHHTEDPVSIMKECVRTSRKFIIIVDHICESPWDRQRLCFMDWAGNLGYDANLSCKYLSKDEWENLYRISNIVCENKIFDLGLYFFPFSMIFGGKLHFMAKLRIPQGK